MGKRAEVIKVNEVVAFYRSMEPFHFSAAGKREREIFSALTFGPYSASPNVM